MNNILFLIVGLIGGFTVVYVKNYITHRSKSIIKDKINTNSSIGNIYKKDGSEPFQWKKFLKIFNLGNGVEWIKSIKEIIDLRKLVIYGVIIGIVFGYGLTEFKRWAFYVGLTIIGIKVLFGLIMLPFAPELTLVYILVSFLYLWFFTNPTALAIFLRKESSAKDEQKQ